jgi:hypothetical protein
MWDDGKGPAGPAGPWHDSGCRDWVPRHFTSTLLLQVEDAACSRDGRKDISNRLCKMIPHVELELAQMGAPLFWSCTAVAGSALLAVALGVWYAWELGFVEKKAIKHKRRFRRTKHTIPWDLIKISEDGDQYETAKPAKNVYSGGKGGPGVPRKTRKAAAAGGSGRSRKDKRA